MKKPKSYMPAGNLNTKRMGELAELAFMYRAASEGIGVAKPYGDSHAYDFLVQHGRRLARVQVKSCFTKVGRLQDGFTILARHRMNKRAGLPYSPEDIDFIAAYIAPCQVWYLIPRSTKRRHFHPGLPEALPRRKNKRAGGFYETYREAWHLLKEPQAAETSDTKQNETAGEPADNAVEPD